MESINIVVFWGIMPYNVISVEVSEENTASVFSLILNMEAERKKKLKLSL
jgi:hypothetical protein